MRITRADNPTSVEVNFYTKGRGRSEVTVQQRRLKNALEMKRLRAFWASALDRLKERLLQ